MLYALRLSLTAVLQASFHQGTRGRGLDVPEDLGKVAAAASMSCVVRCHTIVFVFEAVVIEMLEVCVEKSDQFPAA